MEYHFTYKTTNLINGKYYLGKHSTCNLKDKYLGSGIGLWKAIVKYGKENFKLEILQSYKTSEEAYIAEKELITEADIKNPHCYNMKIGGEGLDPEYVKELWKDPAHRAKMKPQQDINLAKGRTPEMKEKRGKIISGNLKEYWKDPDYRNKMSMSGERNGFYNRKHTENTRSLMKAKCGSKKEVARKKKATQGTIFVTNDIIDKRIFPKDLNLFLESNPGWRKGGKKRGSYTTPPTG